jgi:hypothetical protein
MPDITDPQVVKWANERARTISDKLTATYYALSAYVADYVSGGIAAKIVAAGASGTIADGATTDGRSLITGTSIVNLKAAVDQMKTAFETAVTGVGSPVTTIAGGIQVNGSPR